jgi:SMC interacting uncharacterized protein involved in chromosome segregation
MNSIIEGMADANALSESIVGKKWIRRLRSDLEAIRSKYANIKGKDDERLMYLAALQGKEELLKSQLDLLQNGLNYEKKIRSDLIELDSASTVAHKKNEGR